MITLAEAKVLCPDVNALLVQQRQQQQRIEQLEAQVQWFERQYWGAKSERRALETLNLGQQLWLGLELLPTPVEPPPRTTSVRDHERNQRKKPTKVVDEDSQLRFGPNVPVEEIVVESPLTTEIPEDQRELVSEKVSYLRLSST